jgi:hypothetical protein
LNTSKGRRGNLVQKGKIVTSSRDSCTGPWESMNSIYTSEAKKASHFDGFRFCLGAMNDIRMMQFLNKVTQNKIEDNYDT